MAKSIVCNGKFFNDEPESDVKKVLTFDECESIKFSCYLFLHKMCDKKSDCNKCQDYSKMSHGDIEVMIKKG
jgi:hypothetical protein